MYKKIALILITLFFNYAYCVQPGKKLEQILIQKTAKEALPSTEEYAARVQTLKEKKESLDAGVKNVGENITAQHQKLRQQLEATIRDPKVKQQWLRHADEQKRLFQQTWNEDIVKGGAEAKKFIEQEKKKRDPSEAALMEKAAALNRLRQATQIQQDTLANFNNLLTTAGLATGVKKFEPLQPVQVTQQGQVIPTRQVSTEQVAPDSQQQLLAPPGQIVPKEQIAPKEQPEGQEPGQIQLPQLGELGKLLKPGQAPKGPKAPPEQAFSPVEPQLQQKQVGKAVQPPQPQVISPAVEVPSASNALKRLYLLSLKLKTAELETEGASALYAKIQNLSKEARKFQLKQKRGSEIDPAPLQQLITNINQLEQEITTAIGR